MKKITTKLIISAQYGDLEALDYLLDEFSKFAKYRISKTLHNHSDIEDCIQIALSNYVKGLPESELCLETYYS